MLLARRCNGMGRGALDVAQRPVPLHSRIAGFGIDGWRQIAERAVRSDCDRQSLWASEAKSVSSLIQQLVAQPVQ